MTVILIGKERKKEFELVADAVADRGGDAVFWNLADWTDDGEVTYDVGEGTVTVERTHHAEDVTGVYAWSNHMFDLRVPPFADDVSDQGVEPAFRKYNSWHGVVNSVLPLFERHGATVITHPRGQHYHETKPLQLAQFADRGIPTPETVFTNDPDRVRRFVEEHDEAIYKPIAGGAPPERLSADDLADAPLDRLANAPVQFQEYVPGDDLRVFFLDGEIVGASRYVSDEWTFKHVPGDPEGAEPADLREEIRESVRRAAEASPLQFGAADVRATEDSYALLEVNKDPRFALHDVQGSTSIANVLAEELV